MIGILYIKSFMNKSMKIYLERINQELNYSESLAKDMPKVRKLTK